MTLSGLKCCQESTAHAQQLQNLIILEPPSEAMPFRAAQYLDRLHPGNLHSAHAVATACSLGLLWMTSTGEGHRLLRRSRSAGGKSWAYIAHEQWIRGPES